MSKSTDKNVLLLVDDDPENIEIVNAILGDTYNVRVALNGVKALELVRQEPPPGLVLLDVVMPRMDGYEVCNRLKADPKTRDIPVIFLTGKTDIDDEARGFEVGAVDYIHKPFSPPIVTARVRTHLMLRDAHDTVTRQLQTLNSQLELARQVQLSILPNEIPELAGLQIAARYLPMSSVGGDFYDFLVVDEKHLGILIADVSGHGLPSALIASMVQSALAWQSAHASDPSQVLSGLNRAINGKFEGHFVTAAYLFVDLDKGIVKYAGAGHPPLLLWQEKLGRVSECVENGLVLGLFADPSYSSVTFSPQRGDRIVMFTDGIVEAKNSGGSEFGVDRVRQILESKHDLPLGRFVDTVLYRLSAWSEHAIGSSQSDDLTLLAIDFNAPDSL
jgi:sigma-B regulation protein RsbU (phosphoserine phosphatase)